MSSKSKRLLRGAALVGLIGAVLLPNLAASVDSRERNAGVLNGMLDWSRPNGLWSGAQPAAEAPDGASRMLSDLLGRRLPSPIERPLSVEFFSSLLRAASFAALPPIDDSYTLFLPIDAAFSQRSGAELDALVHNPNALQSLVGSHLVSGRVSAADLQAGRAVQAVNGQPIAAEAADELAVNGATVIGTVELDHGIVHFIDRLL